MSVQVNQFLLYGVKLTIKNSVGFYDSYEEYYDTFNAYDEEIKPKNGISCIYDGENGEYVFVGRIIFKTTDDSPIFKEPFTMPEFTPLEKEFIISSVKLHFKEFNIKDEEFKYWIIPHYS